jgi:hypothetical protein
MVPVAVYDCAVTRDESTGLPTILFGAFDRHNFGDLLFPHIAAALLEDKHCIFAGLAASDMRPYGGHQVRALAELSTQCRDRQVNIMHVGGELLGCDAWEAAVMLLPADQAQEAIKHFDQHPQEKLEWARGKLGISALAPYTIGHELFPHAPSVTYNAVGGVDLDQRDPALRAEVLSNLKAADVVTVRDKRTQWLLALAGITARLLPDPAVMVAELFGARIRERAAQMSTEFAQGYIAVQFSVEFGDDETLAEIASRLDEVAHSTGYGVVFFRAGAAPWHDDLLSYQRAAARMRSASVKIFTSLDVWDICALIAGSRVYCGSSLHGRIVAMAFALPRINLLHPVYGMNPTKQVEFAATWEDADMPGAVSVDVLADGVRRAMATDSERRLQTAKRLVEHYLEGSRALRAAIK